MSFDKNWNIEIDVQVQTPQVDIELLTRAIQVAMRRFRERQATITITVVGDERMRSVHEEFLKSDETTDVISFDLTDEFERNRVFEIVVNAEMAVRQAEQLGHNVQAELALYVVHGLLHNLGLDDADPYRARQMHDVEEFVLEKIGFEGIYYDNA